MPHIVLLGDSIFDNGRYTLGEPDVISCLSALLPPGWRASLLAIDGSTTTDIPAQLSRVPENTSHLVLSVGGNNAIMNAGILSTPVSSSAEALSLLSAASRLFEEEYRRVVTACMQLRLPLALCTIYNGCFPDPLYQELISTALMVFNDVILRVGVEHHLKLIDLRSICRTTTDYANPIEPSSSGGAKIADAIRRLIAAPDADMKTAMVYGG